MGGAVETFAEEEPGDDAAEHPEDKGDIPGRLGFEADLEHHPEDGNVDRRVNEGPEDAEVGAEVFAAEILLGQLQYHPAALEEIPGKKEKNTEIIHGGILRESSRRVKSRMSCSPMSSTASPAGYLNHAWHTNSQAMH